MKLLLRCPFAYRLNSGWKRSSIKILHQNGDLMDSVKKKSQDESTKTSWWYLQDHPRTRIRGARITPIYKPFHGHLEGVLRGTYMVLSYICSELHRFQNPPCINRENVHRNSKAQKSHQLKVSVTVFL